MRVAPRLVASVLSVACGLLAVGAGAAQAETIHTPTDGITVQEDQSVAFDWAWDSDQYASRLLFTQNPDPQADVWFNGTAPAKIRVSDGGYSFTSSHATVIPQRVGLTPGQWYWRLCSYTVNGEDDVCYVRDTPHPIAITAVPAPPPPPVTVPTPTPAPKPPAAAPTPAPVKPFARTTAVRAAKLGINKEFGYKRAPAKRRLSCGVAVKKINRCTASWETGRYRYRGTVRVSPSPFTRGDIAEVKADPTELEDNDYWYAMKLMRTTKTTKRTKTITVG